MKAKKIEWIGFLVSILFSFSVAYAEEGDAVVEEEQPAAVVEEPASEAVAEQQPTRELYLEINKLEQRDESCIAYVRFNNKTDTSFAEFKPELFAFNKDDIITAHFAAIFSDVPANKTVVKLVSMKNTNCDNVGSILLNKILSCRDSESSIDGCMRFLTTGAKGAIKLFK
ncbi:MAG: hypothetical protein H8D24_07545 [Gammaproteobacteria bacterium]|uniref:Tat pathway signal sequence domain protein n=1 Tax=Candidatus Thiopontia autotrophica TaxID=2841688 RepID=A0A8J6P947_9GAMM|nr:hypothetical protein [Candidatus Thiopontia autotrophica]